MGEHKGTITIIIAVLIVFGIFVAFATGILDPVMESIGEGFTNMVNSVFDAIPSAD